MSFRDWVPKCMYRFGAAFSPLFFHAVEKDAFAGTLVRLLPDPSLVAQIIIPMTRMIAHVCANTRESKGSKAQPGLGRAPEGTFCTFLLFLQIWSIIIVIRMIIWATRMISPIILNHPRVGQKPAYSTKVVLKHLEPRLLVPVDMKLALGATRRDHCC